MREFLDWVSKMGGSTLTGHSTVAGAGVSDSSEPSTSVHVSLLPGTAAV